MRTRTAALSIAVAILAVCAYWFVLGTFHLRALQGDPVSWWAFDLQKDNIEQIKFDFIIVGAGVTGSVIAARLNKIGYRVLLLEKGGPDVYGEDLFDIIIAPSQFTHTVNDPRFSWSYATTEQPSLNGRRVPIPQAKVYGGNAMIAPLLVHIPSKQYFEDWKVKGWEYENMQKIFDVVRLNQSSPITHNSTLEFLNAAKSLGYKTLDDTKGEEGFGTVPVMQQAGRRWTSADTHLKYAIRWSNRKEKMLKHTIGVQATKVLFNNNKVATGVEFVDATGKKFVAHASKEVILCAGAINTPQLLMLSGVGPKQQLDAHGIQVVADLPGVGKNLQDQIAIPVIFESKLPSLQTERTVSNEVHWILFGEGPLASSVFEGVGLVKSQPSLQHPDIQLIIAPVYYENHKSNFDRDALTILVTVPQPHSKGTVELQSSDPLAAPKINPNFLGDKQDLQVLLKGFEVARKLAQSTKNVVGQELIPGSKVEGESGFLKYVQEQLIGLFFQVGTCRIGSDANAVVDENLLVKGIQNLRVVDASILPSQPAGNPYITLLAVAEKAVLSITQKYQQ